MFPCREFEGQKVWSFSTMTVMQAAPVHFSYLLSKAISGGFNLIPSVLKERNHRRKSAGAFFQAFQDDLPGAELKCGGRRPPNNDSAVNFSIMPKAAVPVDSYSFAVAWHHASDNLSV